MKKALALRCYLKRAMVAWAASLCLASAGYAAERDVTLLWEESIDAPYLQSYVVYYYTTQGVPGSLEASDYAVSYQLAGGDPIPINPLTVPKQIAIDKSNTQITLHFADDSKTYYFAVTAVDTRRLEGKPSNEASTIALSFPHVAADFPWQTEIAVINTGDRGVAGILKAFDDGGRLLEAKALALPGRGRRQIAVADEFIDSANIGYVLFDTNTSSVQGYAKFYIEGSYRAAIPAVKEVNGSDIHIPHIALTDGWWTGISLVNTTPEAKDLTITFNNGQTGHIALDARGHKTFDVAAEFFNHRPQPEIESAEIADAGGVIGLAFFGCSGWGALLEGVPLTDKTARKIHYPHVASNAWWWTGIVAYNPSETESAITITPYNEQGKQLVKSTRSIPGKARYFGAVSHLKLPYGTAWFSIESDQGLSGFELFGTNDGRQLGAYAKGGGMGAKEGVFPKIEKLGWTGIAFVNTEAATASVTLTAFDDNGAPVGTRQLAVRPHAKVVDTVETLFPQDIGGATYIAYTSDRNVVGFQLNGSQDGTMLDGLPGM